MDPKSQPSRPSTRLPQGSPPRSSMQPQYPVSRLYTLPPLQSLHPQWPASHHYVGQPYRSKLSQFPAPTHDAYEACTAPMPHATVSILCLHLCYLFLTLKHRCIRKTPGIGLFLPPPPLRAILGRLLRHPHATAPLISTVFPPEPSDILMPRFQVRLLMREVRTALPAPMICHGCRP